MPPIVLLTTIILLFAFQTWRVSRRMDQRNTRLAELEARSRELEETMGLDLTPTAVIQENERIIYQLDDAIMPMLSLAERHNILKARNNLFEERTWTMNHQLVEKTEAIRKAVEAETMRNCLLH